MQNHASPLPEGWADDADLLACLMAAWDSYGAREPLAVCVGGEVPASTEVPAAEGEA